MLCPECKGKNADDARRCIHCGVSILPGEGLPEPEESSLGDYLLILLVLLIVAGVGAFAFQTELRNYLNPEAQVEVECMSEARARLKHELTPENGWRQLEPSALRPGEVCFERSRQAAPAASPQAQ